MLVTVTYALLRVQVPMPRRFYTKYTAVHQLMINAMSHGKVPKRTRDPEMASQRELLGYVNKSDASWEHQTILDCLPTAPSTMQTAEQKYKQVGSQELQYTAL